MLEGGPSAIWDADGASRLAGTAFPKNDRISRKHRHSNAGGVTVAARSIEGEALKIGIIADAHGNLAALEAAMAAMSAAAPDMVVNLGDLVSGPFDPAGSAEAQMRSGYLTIAGNHERQLQDDSEGTFDVLARLLLTQDHWTWIRNLPATLTLCEGDVFACHGSRAGGDLEHLLEDVTSGRAALDADVAIRPRLQGIGSASLCCAGIRIRPAWLQSMAC